MPRPTIHPRDITQPRPSAAAAWPAAGPTRRLRREYRKVAVQLARLLASRFGRPGRCRRRHLGCIAKRKRKRKRKRKSRTFASREQQLRAAAGDTGSWCCVDRCTCAVVRAVATHDPGCSDRHPREASYDGVARRRNACRPLRQSRRRRCRQRTEAAGPRHRAGHRAVAPGLRRISRDRKLPQARQGQR